MAGNHPCCCADLPNCNGCADQVGKPANTDNAPLQWSVTFAGFVGNCTFGGASCLTANGTFICDLHADSDQFLCRWDYIGQFNSCVEGVRVTIQELAGNKMRVTVINGTSGVGGGHWTRVYDPQPDCLTLINQVIPIGTGFPSGCGVAATCTLSAI